MDFQKVADSFSPMTCVISVEKTKDGDCGKLRIVTGNKAYIDSIENPAPGMNMEGKKFVPNCEYTEYLNKDLNFEDYCYRSAVEKKCLHAYVHPEIYDFWFNMTYLPLAYEEENLYYCTYTMEVNVELSTKSMTSISKDLAAEVLETSLKLRGTKDFKATMDEIMSDILNLCLADHCCILLLDRYERKCKVLGQALVPNKGYLPMEEYLDEYFYGIADSWDETVIAGSSCLIAKNKHDMDFIKERNPEWHASLQGAKIHNIVLFPIKSQGTLLGYLWALNFDPERAIRIKETLELASFILGSEIGNYLLVDRLKILSSRDMLTGVCNRNEMNNYVDKLGRIRDDKSIGVIFADINGLKVVNDQKGHNAGDDLIRNAAKALKEVFNEEEIFRAGGDEFTMIITNISEEKLNDKVNQIRKVCEKYDGLHMALGACAENDYRNIRTALRIADERMYEDKKAFYDQHPELRR